jgi:hypothetical protein
LGEYRYCLWVDFMGYIKITVKKQIPETLQEYLILHNMKEGELLEKLNKNHGK